MQLPNTYSLKINLYDAADPEEITIILDRIKRQILDGYRLGADGGGESSASYCWTMEYKPEAEPEPVNA